jgi:hypothetical protein
MSSQYCHSTVNNHFCKIPFHSKKTRPNHHSRIGQTWIPLQMAETTPKLSEDASVPVLVAPSYGYSICLWIGGLVG